MRAIANAIYQSRDVAVFDDVLSSTEFGALFRHLGQAEYRSVHRDRWCNAWRLHDGNPLRSDTAWYDPSSPTPASKGCYPTSTPIDALVSWIEDAMPQIESIVGKANDGWQRLSLTPWIYPPGSGLSLHRDGRRYSGAFAFFAHQEWHLHWGGHLLILDSQTPYPENEDGLVPPFLGDNDENAFDPGFALSVLPKSNRIVFLAPNAQHLITRVDKNAGQFARLSIAGFFQKSATGPGSRAFACD